MDDSLQTKTETVTENPVGVVYASKFSRTVDKGRVSLPTEWRKKGWPSEYALLPWPIRDPECLLAMPPERWERFRQRIAPKSLTDKAGRSFQRYIQNSVAIRALDDYGRLPLPEETIKKFGLEPTAQLVGMNDLFEIWPTSGLEQAISSMDPSNLEQTADELDP